MMQRITERGQNSNTQNALTTTDTTSTNAYDFEDDRTIDDLQKNIELGNITHQLDNVGLIDDVDDATAEDVHHALHLLTLLTDDSHLDEHQLTLSVETFEQVDHLHDFDQSIQVLGDLFDHVIEAENDHHHA